MAAITRNAILFALFALLAAAAFRGSWNFGFVNYDDPTVIVGNEVIEGPGDGHLARVFGEVRDHAYLPLWYASYWIDHAIAGKEPAVYHLVNILLQLCAALLLFGVIRRLPLGEPKRRSLAAGLGAAVFLGHPTVVESVVWASGRKDLVAGLLFLVALRLFLAGLERDGLWRRSVLAPLVYLLALFAKASVLPGFLIAFLLARLVVPPERRSARALALATLPMAAAAVLALVVHLAVAAAEGTTAGHEGAVWARAIGMLGALGRYGLNVVAPFRLSLVYDLPLDGSLGLMQVLGLIVLALALAAALRFRSRPEPVPAALLWFVLALAPFNNILPRFAGVMADRYLHLPMMGVGLLVAALVARGRGFGLRASLAALLVVGLAVLAGQRSQVWSDSRLLWEDARAKAPNSSLPLLQLGQLDEEEAGAADPARALVLLDDAARRFAEAEELADGARERAQALLKLASLEVRRGRFELALAAFDRLAAALPDRLDRRDRDELDHAAVTRATALTGLGRLDEARAALAGIDRESPAWKEARQNEAAITLIAADRVLREARYDADRKRGVELYQRGLEIYAELLRLHPRFETARVEQANALIGARWAKDYEILVTKAVNDLVRDFPKNARAWYQHARVYAEVGETGSTAELRRDAAERALADLKISVQLDPYREETYLLLVRLLRSLGANKEAKLVIDRGIASLPDSSRLKTALAETYVSFGHHHKNSGSLDLALEAAARALEVLPDLPDAWQLLGETQQSLAETARDPEEQRRAWLQAEKAWRRLLELDDHDAAARRGLALFHRVRGYAFLQTVLPRDIPEDLRREQRTEIRRQAMEEFLAATTIAPGIEELDNVRVQLEGYAAEFRRRADALLEEGKPADAWIESRAAFRFGPDDPDNVALMARTKAALGLPDEALSYYEQALAIDPKHMRSLFDCGRLLYDRRSWEKAGAMMQRFIDVVPADAAGALAELRSAAEKVVRVAAERLAAREKE